jgi:hypothetical protein
VRGGKHSSGAGTLPDLTRFFEAAEMLVIARYLFCKKTSMPPLTYREADTTYG